MDPGLDADTLRAMLRKMLLLRAFDDRMFRAQRQGKTSFYMKSFGDTIEARKLMNLSISCDHRVVDGWDAANYVQALKKLLETPVLLFAD